jgi:hypothetical protein
VLPRADGTDVRASNVSPIFIFYNRDMFHIYAPAEFAPPLQRALAHIHSTQLPARRVLRCDGNLITSDATLEARLKVALTAQAQ